MAQLGQRAGGAVRLEFVASLCCLLAILGLYPSIRSAMTASATAAQYSSATAKRLGDGGGAAAGEVAAAARQAQKAAEDAKAAAEKVSQLARGAAAAAAGSGGAAAEGAAAEGSATAPSSRATTKWFKPTGYHVPDECWKHEDLYTGVYETLRPWLARGITKADIDACGAPAATPETDITLGTPNGHRFRMFINNKDVVITSGGLRRKGHIGVDGLNYFMIEQIQDAARKFGLPQRMEFVVGFGDVSHIQKEENGGRCPLLVYCKHPHHYDILIPDGQFKEFKFDEWIKAQEEGEWPAWDQREPKASGFWHRYRNHFAFTDRFGKSEPESRIAYMNHSMAEKDEFTMLRTAPEGYMNLGDQRKKYRYTLHVDGIGCSNRFQKQMATNTVIIKDDSVMTEFFYYALKPWVHYVPSGFNGRGEVSTMVKFLRKNDDLAQAIAQQARQFAKDHLNEEGRLCYIKVLFEEMKQLMKYEVMDGDFPVKIRYDEEVKDHVEDKSKLELRGTA